MKNLFSYSPFLLLTILVAACNANAPKGPLRVAALTTEVMQNVEPCPTFENQSVSCYQEQTNNLITSVEYEVLEDEDLADKQFLEGEIIAFIGSPKAVSESPLGCMHYTSQPSEEVEAICMDRAFVLKYQVSEILSGAIAEPTIEFIGFHHYDGMPRYTMYDRALVTLKQSRDHLLLDSINPLEKSDGEWKVCVEYGASDEDECLIWNSVNQFVRHRKGTR